jgi:hypothetical protein
MNAPEVRNRLRAGARTLDLFGPVRNRCDAVVQWCDAAGGQSPVVRLVHRLRTQGECGGGHEDLTQRQACQPVPAEHFAITRDDGECSEAGGAVRLIDGNFEGERRLGIVDDDHVMSDETCRCAFDVESVHFASI